MLAALVLVYLLLASFELDLDLGFGLPHCFSDLSVDEAFPCFSSLLLDVVIQPQLQLYQQLRVQEAWEQ